MAKAPRPRNFEFLRKFSYYIPSVADMFILLAFLLLGGLLGNLVVLPMVALLGQDAGMQYGMLVSYPLMFIPAMIYASVKSRGNSFTKDGLLLDSNHFKPHSGALCGLAFLASRVAFSYSSASFGSRLAYKTNELATYSAEQFRDLWAEALFYLPVPEDEKKED